MPSWMAAVDESRQDHRRERGVAAVDEREGGGRLAVSACG